MQEALARSPDQRPRRRPNSPSRSEKKTCRKNGPRKGLVGPAPTAQGRPYWTGPASLHFPEQRPIEYPGRYPFGEPAALPLVGCVARLHDHRPARDFDKDCSDLTVIWFQDDYAFPLSEEAARAIRDLEWEKLACDREH